MALIMVNRMIGLDRHYIQFNKTAYYKYGKSVISIPDKLHDILLYTLRMDINNSLSIQEEIEWISTAIYCAVFKIKRKLVDLGIITFECSLHNITLYYLLYSYIEIAINNIDLTELYSIDLDEHLIQWIKLCGYLHDKIMLSCFDSIVGGLNG